MKNRIWVGKNDVGSSYQSDKELIVAENGNIREKVSKDDCRASDSYKYDIYNLNLKPLEIVEIIIDTETQKYEVKRPREIGWYLVECKSVEDDGLIFACHWNGENWNPMRNKNKWRKGTIWKGLDENEVTVHSEKLPYNEYLKSLE